MRTVLRGAAVLSSGSIAANVLQFAFAILIARVLGQDGLGTYGTVLAWIFPLSLLVEYGIGTILTRDIARNRDNTTSLVSAAIRSRLLIGLPAVIGLWFISPLLSSNPSIVTGLQIAAPLVLIQPLFSIFSAVFRAQLNMRLLALLGVGMSVGQVALGFVVLAAGGDIIAVLLLNTITSALQLGAAYIIFRQGHAAQKHQHLPLMALLSSAGPFALAGIIAALQLRLPLILLEQWHGAAAAGVFVAASRMIDAGRLIAIAFLDTLYPALSNRMDDTHAARQLFARAIMLCAPVCGIVAVGIHIFAPAIINLLYGGDFAVSADILRVLGWMLAANTLKGAGIIFLFATDKPGISNRANIIALMIEVSLCAVWISSNGAYGAAYVLLVSELIGAGLVLLAVWRELRHFTPPDAGTFRQD